MLVWLTTGLGLDIGAYTPMIEHHGNCGKKYCGPRLYVGLTEMMKWEIRHKISTKEPPNFSDRAS